MKMDKMMEKKMDKMNMKKKDKMVKDTLGKMWVVFCFWLEGVFPPLFLTYLIINAMKKYLFIATGILFSLQVLAQTGLKNGTVAPEFSAKENLGKTLELKVLLKSHKAVVLFSNRGWWRPYCNKQIKQLSPGVLQIT